MADDLGINVGDNVQTKELFGELKKNLKGVAGTLHLTRVEDKEAIVNTAWTLSESSGKPVVIVVRA